MISPSKCTRRHVLILFIVMYLLYTVGVIYLWNHPEEKYELFIFTQSKIGIIILTVPMILLCVVLLLITTKKYIIKEYIQISLIILPVLTVLTSIFLWRILGYYYIVGMDLYNYMGMTKDIMHFSYIPRGTYYPNFYPAQPLLYASLSIISTIDIFEIFVYAPIGIYILVIITLYLLTTQLIAIDSRNIKKFMMLVPLLVLPNFFNEFIYPYNQTFSIILFGIFLFVYLKINSNFSTNSTHTRFSFVLIIMLAILPPTHPIPAYLVLLLLISNWISNRITRDNTTKDQSKVLSIYLILFVSWFFIISYQGLWVPNIKNHIKLMFEYTTAEATGQLIQTTITAGKSTGSLIVYALIKTHPILIYLVIGLVISLKILLQQDNFRPDSVLKSKILQIIKLAWLPIIGYFVPALAIFLHNPIRLTLDNPFVYIIVPLAILGVSLSLSKMITFQETTYKKEYSLLIILTIGLILTSSLLQYWAEYRVAFYPSKTKTWQEPISVKFYETNANTDWKIYVFGAQTQINAYISKDLGMYYRPSQYQLDTLDINRDAYIFVLRKSILTYTILYPRYKYSREFLTQIPVKFNLVYSNNEVKIYAKL